MSKRNNQLAANVALYAIGNFGSKLLSLLLVPFYTYYILPKEFGYFDLAISTISLIVPLATMQISDGIYRFLIDEKSEDKINDIIKTASVITLVQLIISNVIIVGLCLVYKVEYWQLILLATDLSILSTLHQRIARGLQKTFVFSMSGLFSTAALLVSNLILIIHYKLGIQALLISYVISLLVNYIYIEVCVKTYRSILKGKICRDLIKQLIKYSIPLIPNLINWWIMNVSDRFLIAYFLGVQSNGIYAISNKFPAILVMANAIFNMAWQDISIKEYKSKDRDSYYTTVFNKMAKFELMSLLILLAVTKPVMDLVISSSYSSAWMYVPFLYLGVVFNLFSSFFGMSYISAKKTSGAMYSSAIGCIANIVINYLLLKKYGLQVASFSTMVAFLFMWIYRIYDTRHLCHIKIDLKSIIPLLLIICGYFVCYYFDKISIYALMFIVSLIIFIVGHYKDAMSVIHKFKTVKES